MTPQPSRVWQRELFHEANHQEFDPEKPLRYGYEMRPIPPAAWRPDWDAVATVKESQYYTLWSAPCPLFTPWAGHPDFQAMCEGVKALTLVSPDRCYVLGILARYASRLSGDFAECGVYRGGTALLFSRILRETRKKLFLFNSFEGLPEANKTYDKHYGKGDFADTSFESVKKALKEFDHLIEFRQGWIPSTFEGLSEQRWAFVHVDVDLFQSALDCCEYFYPRLIPGGGMVFDDYGFAMTRGDKDAGDQFFGINRSPRLSCRPGKRSSSNCRLKRSADESGFRRSLQKSV